MDGESQHDDSDVLRQTDVVDQEFDHSGDLDFPRIYHQSLAPAEEGQKPKSQHKSHSTRKWALFQEFYRDSYAELLQAEVEVNPNDGIPSVQLDESQIGAVTWYSDEKEALYCALASKGIRNLPQLAKAVGSKSMLEIQDYLLLLRAEQSERHLFHEQTQAISPADIPAAVEVGFAVESALEKAADAQLAYEDYFEHVTGLSNNHDSWIIDRQAAKQLDVELDKVAEASEDDSDELGEATFEVPIFHLSTFIELSEKLFMNCGKSNTSTNWRNIAMEGQTPAVTQKVISEMYDLAVNFTRKLVQTSLFLAQSRQRATTSRHYRHRSMVRDQDVTAAINVLNLRCDLWDFWVGVPRRNKLIVVDKRHTGGNSKERQMSYDAVEQILSKRKDRWRGRRRSSSTSTGTGTSMTEDEVLDAADQVSQEEEDEASSGSSAYHNRSTTDDDEAVIPEAHPLDAILDSSSSDEAQNNSPEHQSSADSVSDGSSDNFDGLEIHAAAARQFRRGIYLERQQDAYLEQTDAQASREEEIRLREILGREPVRSIEAQNNSDVGEKIPSEASRKSIDDLRNPLQSTTYGAEWELFGAAVPNDCFLDTERARKRSRTMPRDAPTHADPGKSPLAFRTRNLFTKS